MSIFAAPSPGPVSIDRMRPVPPAEDFARLKAEVLGWLPVWCEGVWSDFNAHDPGIMILEQWLYGLTELSYRANLPIDDLLKRDRHGEIPWSKDSLYAPTEILPMAPLTAGDYARFLYDRMPEVRYVSIDAFPFGARAGGRLGASLFLDLAVADPTPVIARAQQLLNQNANIGERFDLVKAIDPVYFTLRVQMQIAPGAIDNMVAKNLYGAVTKALQPTPRFRTFVEATADETIDVALTGPLLNAGVLDDDDLPCLLTWVEAQALAAQELFRVPGVTAVTKIEMTAAINSTQKPEIGCHWFVPYPEVDVSRPSPAPGCLERVMNFSPQSGDPPAHAFREAAAELIGAARMGPAVQFQRLLPEPGWLHPKVPHEAATQIGTYYSIQSEFPPCFGLIENGLPVDASAQRRAQMLQLKGYLLVFEQLLANYFVQLEHTIDYFSNRPQTRTAYTQPLSTVPGVLPLIEGYCYDDRRAGSAEQARHAEAFWRDPANPYLAGLRSLVESESEFLARRNRVLDHLLARFNEYFPATPDEATFETIRNKEDLLRKYRQLGHGRAQAADHTVPAAPDRRRARSGLEKKLQLLLRRETQLRPPALEKLSARVRPRQPADFYFVIESVRFLPKCEEPSAGESWSVPFTAFQPALFHTFINWTCEPLNSAFKDYAEELVFENAPAHLLSHVIWLETQPEPEPAAGEFVALFRAWAEAGYPALQMAVDPAPLEGVLRVVKTTPAARLLHWLLLRCETAVTSEPVS